MLNRTGTDSIDAAPLRLRRAIRALVRRFSISERADVACCGMTVAQAATLEALGQDGALRLGDLGRRLGISASTLTRNLARMEERGLVRRAGDPNDRRAMRVRLTAEGRRAAQEVESRELRFARSIFEALPDAEQSETLRSLEQLLAAVHRATESCCGDAFDHLIQEFPRPIPRGE